MIGDGQRRACLRDVGRGELRRIREVELRQAPVGEGVPASQNLIVVMTVPDVPAVVGRQFGFDFRFREGPTVTGRRRVGGYHHEVGRAGIERATAAGAGPDRVGP